MSDNKGKKIAIIPARGGSKRIPRKNIKPFYGKPMIGWSIEAAFQSQIFDEIIVSTDDSEIAEIAKSFGANVPFIRPPELSNDFAGTTEVIAHSIQWATDNGWNVYAACCIYATAPFIQIQDIVSGWEKLQAGSWNYSFTVTDYAAPIFRSFELNSTGGLSMFYPEHFSTRSQDLPQAYHDAGQFYWGKTEAWLKNIQIFSGRSTPIVIPRWRVQDIDTLEDWHRAELIAGYLLQQASE